MIGFRGASRYIADNFRECFALECRAVRKVREDMGLTNLEVMIPFVRTLDEARAAIREEISEQRAALDEATRRVVEAGLATWSGETGGPSLIVRGQMRLLDDVTALDDLERVRNLFDALETDAMKVAAPAGYSVCNDTNETLWTALAFRRGKAWATRGWWQMAAGACVRALTTALQANHIYLLVERKNGERIVTGKTEFCIASVAFDIEKRGDCKTRGLTAAGFATTDTRGRSGFTAHVSEDGLLPPLRLPQ